jgi:hypothetical protein
LSWGHRKKLLDLSLLFLSSHSATVQRNIAGENQMTTFRSSKHSGLANIGQRGLEGRELGCSIINLTVALG